jgi:hypothetical protein
MAIRMGVVGLGQIARKRHLPAIAGDPRFVLAGLSSLGGGPDVAGIGVHADHRTTLARCAPDAVAICTPPAAREGRAQSPPGIRNTTPRPRLRKVRYRAEAPQKTLERVFPK